MTEAGGWHALIPGIGILIMLWVVGSLFEAPVTHRLAPVSPVSFPNVH